MTHEKNSNEASTNLGDNAADHNTAKKADVAGQCNAELLSTTAENATSASAVLWSEDRNVGNGLTSDVELRETTRSGNTKSGQFSEAELRKIRASVISTTSCTIYDTGTASNAKLGESRTSVMNSKRTSNLEIDRRNPESHSPSEAKLQESRVSVMSTASSKSTVDALPSDESIIQTYGLTSQAKIGVMNSVTSGISYTLNDELSTNASKSTVENISTTSVDRPTNLSRSISLTNANTSSGASIGESRRMSKYRKTSIRNSFARREFTPAEFVKNPLEDLDNKHLVDTVEELQKNTRYLELENKVLWHFLQKNDPSLLEGMDAILEAAQNRSERASTSSKRMTRLSISHSTYSKKASSSALDFGGTFSLAPTAVEKEGPRINITQKTDLILREMEEIKYSIEASTIRFQILKYKLKAHLEEMSIRESEISDTWTIFENVFITTTVERYTQKKNPAEKFIRFMEEWFTNSRLALDKIRLRTSSLQVQYQKVCHQLTQKQLLGANLQIVDFEQLQIENKHLSEKIDHRNLLLLELKRINGKANLLLSQNKKQLSKQSNYLKNIKRDILFKEDATRKFDNECEKISLELESTKEEYDKIKERTETYEVPEVIDYVKTKADLSLVKKNLKIWGRRKQIQDMALVASVRQMKLLTAKSTPESSWFKDPRETHTGNHSLESTFEFAFQRRRPSPISAKFNSRISRQRSILKRDN